MFSTKKLKQYAKDILFPPFSERELVTLVYLIALLVVVAVIKNPILITSAITEWAQQLTFQSPYGLWDFVGAIIGTTKVLWYGLIVLLVVFMLYDIAIKQRRETLETKKFVAYLFYTALSLISVLVLLRSSEPALGELLFTTLSTGRLDMSALFNSVIAAFLFLRSMLTNFVTYVYVKLDQEHLLAMRMTDEQMSRMELVMLVVAATTIFLFLIQGHDHPVAALLSYFYVTLLFDIYRKIFPQPDPAFIKSIKEIKLK